MPLALASGAPMFTVADSWLGDGPVGGKVNSGYFQGRTAGELALRLLAGEPIEHLPVVKRMGDRYMFDYPALVRWHISESALPPGSLILNRPFSFYETYTTLIWATLLVLSCLTSAVLVLAANILRRRRAEEALRQSEERFSEFMAHFPGQAYIKDSDRRHIYLNKTLERWDGRTGWLGHTAEEMLAPEIAARIREADDRVLAGETVVRTEDVLSPTGREQTFLVYRFPIHQDGGPPLIGGLAIDITDRRRAEEAVRESEIRFRALTENAPFGVSLMRPDLTLEYLNPRFTDIFGYALEDLPNLAAWLEKAFPDPAARRKARTRCEGEPAGPACGGEAADRTATVRCRDGRDRSIRIRTVALPDGRRLCTYEDITDREILESQLRQAQKMEAIGQLAGGVAHDFNNMLTVVMGHAQILRLDLAGKAEQADMVDRILEASERAADLARKLLAFARKSALQAVPVDVHQSIDHVIGLLMRSLDKSIEIETHLRAAPAMVMGDPGHLQNALLNLAINARDAMPQGGRLTFSTENVTLDDVFCRKHGRDLKPGRYVQVAIADTGVGMDKDTLARLFEPFFTTKGVGKGTGLGLASVYGCVKQHHGTIVVYSEPGHGTVFRMVLPAAGVQAPAVAEPEAASTPPKPRQPARILLAEDEEGVRDFAAHVLRAEGHDVTACANGLEAVAHFQRHHASLDLVILDMIMPKMAGAETLARLRQINPNVPVIVASGFSASGTTDQCLRDGAKGFLHKPFQINELLGAVARVLEA